MKSVEFESYVWKGIQWTCGAVVAPENCSRTMLKSTWFECESGWFQAYGSNGYQLSRLNGRCVTEEDGPIHFLLPVMKTPAGTKVVKVFPFTDTITSEQEHFDVHKVMFYDKNGNLIKTVNQRVPVGEYIDVHRLVKIVSDKIDRYDGGRGQYFIRVNPRYLMNALSGFKDAEAVVLNFGSRMEPFMIRSANDESLEAMALVYPIRS